MVRRRREKRGIILLVVLSLLVLFLVIAATFAVVAGQYRVASETAAAKEATGDAPHKLLQEALHQLIRDTSTRSALRGHSLLGDLYGNDGVMGMVVANTTGGGGYTPHEMAGNEFIRFHYFPPEVVLPRPSRPRQPFGRPFSLQPDYYNGRVLTFLSPMHTQGPDNAWGVAGADDDTNGSPDDEPEAGRGDDGQVRAFSTRIVDYIPYTPDDPNTAPYDPLPGQIVVERPESDYRGRVLPRFSVPAAHPVNPPPPPALSRPSLFLIDGQPFNGSGHGLAIATAGTPTRNIDATLPFNMIPRLMGPGATVDLSSDFLVALLPHFNAYPAPLPYPPNLGGADEDYDAVDYQNMFMAMVPSTSQFPIGLFPGTDPTSITPKPPAMSHEIIPSFHRPALINFWFNRVAYVLSQPPYDVIDPDAQRRIFLYPYGENNKKEPVGVGDDPVGGAAGVLIPPGPAADILDEIVYLKRLISMRPLAEDHPDFTGSNPNYALLAGTRDNHNFATDGYVSLGTAVPDGYRDHDSDPPSAGGQGTPLYSPGFNRIDQWDVDNDGDGIPDSIWIDIGLPVQKGPDGRMFKPLAAILCRDLDGRININASSNQDQLTRPVGVNPQLYADPLSGALTSVPAPVGTSFNSSPFPPAPPNARLLPRGVGFGPADIYIGHIFDAKTDAIPTAPQLDFANILDRRYGLVADNTAGRPGVNDPLSWIKDVGLPTVYGAVPHVPAAYGLPPDAWGRGALALDPRGQPLTVGMWKVGEDIDDPYELNLTSRAAQNVDQPFGASELERILRWSDVDAESLPDRLLQTALRTFNDPHNHTARNVVTTDSFSIPVPLAGIPNSMRVAPYDVVLSSWDRGADLQPGRATVDDNNLGGQDEAAEDGSPFSDDKPPPVTILDLYRLRLEAEGFSGAALNFQLATIVPFEMRHGARFNVNRPLGNSVNDNPGLNETIDELGETDPAFAPGSALEYLRPALAGGQGGFGPAIPFDPINGDLIFSAQGNQALARRHARQIYARHLYCLMMLLTDPTSDAAQSYTPPFLEETTLGLTQAEQDELRAHKIAQWAINVVDFRDPDAIMTPFEYDVNPWNGWDPGIDGNPATDKGPPPRGTNAAPDRRIVWGAEYPDLLITETTAFHDRRVADTIDDNGIAQQRPNDPNLDQIRIPQGSVFLELYCPRNSAINNPQYPRELYNVDGNLDLGRVSPASGDPVWRIAFSAQNPDPEIAPRQRLQTGGFVDTTAFSPIFNTTEQVEMDLLAALHPGLYAARSRRLTFERYATLAPVAPANLNPGNAAGRRNLATYYGRTGQIINGARGASNLVLGPGRYAVVGPRPFTRAGSLEDPDPVMAPHYIGSPHTFQITSPGGNPGPFFCVDNDNVDRYQRLYDITQDSNAITPDPYRPVIQPPLGIVCAAHPPENNAVQTGWTNNPLRNAGIGLNVSEPLPNAAAIPYYPEPGFVFDTTPNLRDGYDEPDPAQRMNRIPDAPLDNTPGYPLRAVGDEQTTGTYVDFRTVCLQRLANPLEPFHAAVNPYITVDWATLDLTVFNGEDQQPGNWDQAMDGDWDPQGGAPGAGPDEHFHTRERGVRTITSVPLPPPLAMNESITRPTFDPGAPIVSRLFNPLSNAPQETSPSGNMDLHWPHNLFHSLGYLNFTMGQPLTAPMPAGNSLNRYTGGPANEISPPAWFPPDAAPPPPGHTPLPFHWLAWHNRPFATPLELMLVPSGDPTRLLFEFDTAANVPPPPDPYDATANAGELLRYRFPFRHLLNFFLTHEEGASPTTAQNLYRLFDLVETPSPFVGTEKWYNPAVMRSGSGLAPDPFFSEFRPPHHKLTRFRDPGKINANTIFDAEVVEGIMKGFPAMDPTVASGAAGSWLNRFILSRRGFAVDSTSGSPPESVLVPDARYPTLFARPFRGAGSFDQAPPLDSRPAPFTPPTPFRATRGVDATLLREDPGQTIGTLEGATAPPVGTPLLAHASSAADTNTVNNAFFAYQGMTRVANLLTTQSNVYAVWITIGYFEVEAKPRTVADDRVAPNPLVPNNDQGGPDALHTDGYLLGQEVGLERGEVQRHRGFYIIDRSVPVAYEPGQDHNVDQAVILRRQIE